METMADSLTQRLHETFRTHAGRLCLRIPHAKDWSYGDVALLAAKFAGVLRAQGIGVGDRVLVQVDKSPEAVALYLACLRIAAVYVPLNTAYTNAEVAYFLGDADPGLFVCQPPAAASLASIAGDVRVLTLGKAGEGSLMEAAARIESDVEVATPAGSDVAAILYTSGTTGRSKGAMLTHQNLLSNALALLQCWGWRDDDVLLHALPIFHVHGLFVALHCAFLSGSPVLFLSGFNAEDVMESLPDATVMMGVPTFYSRFLDHPAFVAEMCTNMRLFISGSAPLTEETFRAWESRTGHKILERYGMSETVILTSNPLDGERVAGTVGFALAGVEMRIADDRGRPLDVQDVGLIEVRGPSVFPGYWRKPEKTAEDFRDDGFFLTGDMGRMDADGRLSIVGRGKDLVISGGYNIYPKEVERLLDAMPSVKESAVIGLPHADLGEAVVAVVVPAGSEVSAADVAAALDGQLARFKHPKRVVNVAELPRNTMGKVQKNELRQRYATLFDD